MLDGTFAVPGTGVRLAGQIPAPRVHGSRGDRSARGAQHLCRGYRRRSVELPRVGALGARGLCDRSCHRGLSAHACQLWPGAAIEDGKRRSKRDRYQAYADRALRPLTLSGYSPRSVWRRPVIAFDLYDTVDSFIAYIARVEGLSPNTVTAYGSRLERFAAWCEREVSTLALPTCAPFVLFGRAFAWPGGASDLAAHCLPFAPLSVDGLRGLSRAMRSRRSHRPSCRATCRASLRPNR
ncbi:MAG: site-specific integrase [Collinsella sp.]